MSSLGSILIWCVVQTTLLALVAALICARSWRIGGASGPLSGLIGVAILTILAFIPLPAYWSMFDASEEMLTLWTERETKSSPIRSLASNEQVAMNDSVETKRMQEPYNELKMQSNFRDLSEKLRNSNTPTSEKPSQSRFRQIILALFVVSVSLGLIRFVIGIAATMKLRESSRPIRDKELDESLTILQARLGQKTELDVHETSELTTAATFGLRRPILLLPIQWREWSNDE